MSVYQDLPLAPGQIRIFKVSHGPTDSPIHCSLEVTTLGSEDFHLDYALSYTWGPPAEYGRFQHMTNELKCPVICNGIEILVAENLVCFLKQARQTPWLAHKSYWVDAVCINQQDLEERSSQVRMMGKIFGSGTKVLIWLGEEDEFTTMALTLLKDLARLNDDQRNQLHPGLTDYGDSKFENFLNTNAWLAVARFFQRTFFNRAWIMQEVVLARRLEVLCGAETLEWDTLAQASVYFAQTAWKDHLIQLVSPDMVDSKCYSHVPAMLQTSRKYQTRLLWADALLHALIRSRHFKSFDLRDKVYCVLGLVEEYIQDRPLLHPKYGDQTVATTYTKAAAQILESSQNLYLLSCVEGPIFQEHPNMPSWVPDWSCGKSLGLLGTGYKRYSAAGELTQRPQIDCESWIITLKGIRLDEVSMVGEAKHEILAGGKFQRWLEIVESLPSQTHGEDRLEVLWRTVIRNTSGTPPIIVSKDSPLAAMFHEWLLERSRGWADAQVNRLLDSDWGRSVRPFTGANNFVTTFTYGKQLRLFRTIQGYLGLGSECVSEGDFVWILPSSPVPLILRPVDPSAPSNRYRLVGGTYIHNFMHGEGVSTLSNDSHFERITIE